MEMVPRPPPPTKPDIAEYPKIVVVAIAALSMREGLASGSKTFVTICHGPAPMDCAASTTPRSTSFKEDSTIRATKGADANTSGTIVAVLPTDVPTRKRVKGMTAINISLENEPENKNPEDDIT